MVPSKGYGIDLNRSLTDEDRVLKEEESVNANADVRVPEIGFEFETLQDFEDFYTVYSRALGFGIRKGTSKSENGALVMRQFLCNKEGHREDKWLRNPNRARKPRDITRTGCKANIRAVLSDSGTWVVSVFEEGHNHEMVGKHCICFIRSNRKVKESDIAEAKLLKASGVKTCQVMNVFAHQAGGFQKVGFTPKDLYNHVHTENKAEIIDGDAATTLMYFDVKSSMGMEIFYRYTNDSDNRLEHLFWCDPICRSDYSSFGDIMAFDTTYKKNSYNQPLLVLVGVDNHHKTIVFGFALLTNKSTETFQWVLTMFMEAMSIRSLYLSSLMDIEQWKK